jgi:pimeloyl-ACP methyl ester carboxylesterase
MSSAIRAKLGYRTRRVRKKLIMSKVAPARRSAAADAGDDYGVTDGPDWRQVDWAAHMHRFEFDGAEVNYVDIGDEGEDRPIVFVHGLSGQWQNWLENIPRFAQERRVVAVDLPGFGISKMPREELSIEFYGRWLERLCDRLGLGPVVLVGNSMGGFVCAETAITRPDRVERMLLLSSAGISTTRAYQPATILVGKIAGMLASSTAPQMLYIARRRALRRLALLVVARHPSRLKVDLVYEGFMKGAGKPAFYDALMACINYDFRERLPQVGCPTLIVWGEKDMILPVEDADEFVSMIPGARRILFKDTGHVPMAERPATFNEVLDEFLHYEVDEGEVEGEGEAREAADSAPAEVGAPRGTVNAAAKTAERRSKTGSSAEVSS